MRQDVWVPPNGPDDPASMPADYFDRFNYAERGRSRFSMYWFARRYYAALVRKYAPTGGRDLLEIGCGLGDLLSLLQDDFACVGVDVLDRSLTESATNAPRAKVLRRSGDDLASFDDGQFDVIVSLHTVEHLADPRRALHEARRISRPGALLLFATPNPVYSMRRYKDAATDAIGMDPTHINVHPPEQWRRWVEEAGYTVQRHFGDGLWDVPYFRRVPTVVQFVLFGSPAFAQVLSRSTSMPLALGVNQVCIAQVR